MEFELRTLTSKDIFPMSSIISKIGIQEFKECFSNPEIQKLIANTKDNKDKEGTATVVGGAIIFDVVGIIMKNLTKCQDELYSFMSSVSGLKRKELEELSMADFAELLVAIIKKDEFKDFIQVVSRLFS